MLCSKEIIKIGVPDTEIYVLKSINNILQYCHFETLKETTLKLSLGAYHEGALDEMVLRRTSCAVVKSSKSVKKSGHLLHQYFICYSTSLATFECFSIMGSVL